MHPQPTPTKGVYPLRRPRFDDDRFTLDLVHDIGQVLTRHGYPPLTRGNDLLRWQNALYAAIYQEKP